MIVKGWIWYLILDFHPSSELWSVPLLVVGLVNEIPCGQIVSALVQKDVLCAWSWATIWSFSGRKATQGLKTKKLQWGWWGVSDSHGADAEVLALWSLRCEHLWDTSPSLQCSPLCWWHSLFPRLWSQIEGRKDLNEILSKNHSEWGSLDFEKGSLVAS